MNMDTVVEAAVVSIRENTNEGTARVNLRWEGEHQISDFALEKLGSVLNSEGETEHGGWVLVQLPGKSNGREGYPPAQRWKMTGETSWSRFMEARRIVRAVEQIIR